MHRRVNILQYIKTSAGKWQWEPIPKNSRNGKYLWSKVNTDHLYIVWREHMQTALPEGRVNTQRSG